MDPQTDNLCYDVVIIGAGISGINFAYRLQKKHPDLRYCILEERHEVGGTWSLFQYPGIRSDSDLFTFGFAWRPWTGCNAIAEGQLIRKYIRESAEQEGIVPRIRFRHRVDRMDWSTHQKLWSLHASTDNSTAAVILQARFVMMGTGYYDYHEPLKTEIPGIEQFQGTVIHPQFWPSDVDYVNKNVVIVGSGATAITLLPSLADKASSVTMLQRSPSYVMSVSKEDAVERFIRWSCPERLAARLIRFKWIFLPLVLVSFCRQFPNLARRLCLSITGKELPEQVPLDPHFMPRYYPWEQRMCMCPDGDFFRCLRNGKASVVTDHIEAVTPKSIRLRSGNELHPDIIVTATGLKMRIAGGIRITVDGSPFFIQDHFMWKCTMVDGLPNVVFALGYVDASWTLGADATAQLACRILKQMKKEGISMVAPRCGEKDRSGMKEKSFLNLNATYVKKGNSVFPKVGDQPLWEPRSYYWKDLIRARWGDIRTDMDWSH
ncbi:Pyridine nucleotide-disulfide oxidoreductase [Aspergillus udagawae]|nr:Pyridine nucleotide-disulfide oxidoreductase [Aspergillus udagawae]